MRRALAVLGLLLVFATAARAEPADASAQAVERAREGEARAKTGDYLGAVPLFKAALALDPRPEYQCNIGVAYYKAQDLPRAQLFLSLCLARGSHLPAEFLGTVRQVLVTIEDTLRAGEFAPVEVSVTPAAAEIVVSSWEADEVVVGSRTLWLQLGEHQLTVSALGYATRVETVVIDGRERVPVTVRLEKPAAKPVPAPPRRLAAPPISAGATSGTAPRNAHLRTMAWMATGATIVVGLGSIRMHVYALETEEEASRIADEFDRDRKEMDAQLQRGIAYFGYTVTAAGILASALLWSRAPASQPTTIGASPTGDGAAVWVSGSF